MAIPYFRGFKVYVDGERSDIVKVGGAMLGVQIKAGEHDIQITYRTYGLIPAMIISIIGWMLVVLYLRLRKTKEK